MHIQGLYINGVYAGDQDSDPSESQKITKNEATTRNNLNVRKKDGEIKEKNERGWQTTKMIHIPR